MTDHLDLIIVGGGPAGMTAGLYASRARLRTKLVEKFSPGGQILNTEWVDNYPGFPDGISGFELADRMRNQAKRFGLNVISGEVIGLAQEDDYLRLEMADGSLTTRTLIVATGSQPLKLGIPGELELVGKGVSYCATCDGAFYKDTEVGVVGGGDTAVEEALSLTKFASKIHLFHRRDELRATRILREQIKAESKVEIHWSSVITEILADDRGLVSGVRYKKVDSGKEFQLGLEGIFMFVGQTPATDFLSNLIELDKAGFIITDPDMATSRPGVWAAGDVRSKKLRQISTAVGDGATAAFSAEKYIEDKFGRTG